MSLFNNSQMMGASAAGAYEIERSLRFNDNDSAYLSRTPSSAGNRDIWTWAGWCKLGNSVDGFLFSAYSASNDAGFFGITFLSSGALRVQGWNTVWRQTNALYRDKSAWYHVVVAVDTTNGTADDRIKLYVNGNQITDFATNNTYTQNDDTQINNTSQHDIGRYTSGDYFDGYLTEIHFVDGTALDASSFGETNEDTGQWIPKRYGGSHGTNGFYLNFSDNSNTTSGTLGDDDSANTNDWTPNNFSVAAGAGNDSFIDTPTNNFCTLNPLTAQGVTLTNGNLSLSTDGNNTGVYATQTIPSSGKWYFELIHNGTGSPGLFYQTDPTSLPRTFQWSAATNNGFFTLFYSGLEVYDGTNLIDESGSPWNSFPNGTVYGLLFDRDNHTMKFRYNNGNEESCDEPTHTRGLPLEFGRSVTTTWAAHTCTLNFGGNGFTYTPPDGYKTISTANLPEPTILKGNDYFNPMLYTGTGAEHAITGLGFSPNVVWTKGRSDNDNNSVFDTVRGANAELVVNSDGVEATGDVQLVKSFDSDGFTLGTNAGVNGNNETYVAWCWKETAAAGFDIVSYTGNGSNRTISHSLGVKPSAMVVRHRGAAGNHWVHWHDVEMDGTNFLYWDTTASEMSHGPIWNSTEPTSSVFSVGTDNQTNQNGINFIAYLWSAVEGYSKFGNYQGNGSTDGPFVYTGFKPAFVMTKAIDRTAHWYIWDNKRSPGNQVQKILWANLNDDEEDHTAYGIDFLSNGFKVRNSESDTNTSSSKSIFMAFAERPFKYANAR